MRFDILTSILLAGTLHAVPNKLNSTRYSQPNVEAPHAGDFSLALQTEPESLHPIISKDPYSESVKQYVFDTLLARDLNTSEWRPRLAERFEISKDKKVYTFYLRKNASFHDGKLITAEDVKYSFDAIFEPKYKATHMRPYFEEIEKVEIVDPATVRVTAKNTYFMNFIMFAGLYIIPKHIYADIDKSVKMSRQVVGSGPYTLEKFEEGRQITLKRFDKWYGFSTTNWKGFFNFQHIVFHFVNDEDRAFKMLKNGELDFLDFWNPDAYMKKTEGDSWDNTAEKNQVENAMPKSYFFVGFNFKKDLFKDRNVRLGLAHLMNREEMNKKFRFDMSLPATGPTYVQSDFASPKVKPIPYDPKRAQKLFAKAGWRDSDKDGVLDRMRNGKKEEFRFTLIHASKDREKYWLMYKEDLKKVGVDMEIKLLDWNTFLKTVDEGSFDTLSMGWTGTIDWDPKQIWHSSSAVSGGSNFISYKNPTVDKLIEKARYEMGRERRVRILQKVYEIIAGDVPYIFMFNDKFSFYANSKNIKKQNGTMKYDIGTDLWWSAGYSPSSR